MRILSTVRPFSLALVLAGSSIFLTSCGDHVVVSPTGDIESAIGRWAQYGGSSYTFVIDSTCGDGRLRGLYEVVVDNDAVTKLRPMNAEAEESGARPSAALTIDDLFTDIGAIQLDDVDVLAADYHIKAGYPTYFAVDPDENTENDETCYTISDVQVG